MNSLLFARGDIISGFGAPSGAPSSVLDTNNTLLEGYFNSSHLSGLQVNYPPANLPTPWPWLLCSMVISLILGCIGVKSGFESWKEDSSPTRFAIIRTLIGFGITCGRSVVAFALAIKGLSDVNRSHPPPSSLLFLLGSIQCYIGNRHLPLFATYLTILCQCLTYGSLMMSVNNPGYGRWAVSGGNCPPSDGLNYAAPAFIKSPNTCLNVSRSWRAIGCQTLPSTDPNDSMNKIVTIENVSIYIGGIYFFTIILALIDTVSIRKSPMYQPIERHATKRLKFAVYMACVSILLGIVYAPIVVSAHYKQLHRPLNLVFADSWGPYQRINRTAASARTASTFNYGNLSVWTDCFTAETPWDPRGDGLFSQWWRSVDPVPRILALI